MERPPGGDEFAAALRGAIRDRGLSLDRVRHHLAARGHHLSIATLSYWQSGRSRPERATSRAALASLEEVLDLPPGVLSALLPQQGRSRGEAPRDLAIEAHLTRLRDRLEVLPEWGTMPEGVVRVGVQESIDLAPDRTLERRRVREIVRAEEDGVRVLPVYGFLDEASGTPVVTAVRNCSLGRVTQDPGRSALVAELVLEQPMRAGEVRLVDYEMGVLGQSEPETRWERALRDRVREAHVEIRFGEGDLPLGAEAYVRTGHRETRRPVTLVDRVLTALFEDVGPGVLGVRWNW